MRLSKKHIDYDDVKLMELAKQESKPDAASILFNRYSDLIYGVCLKYLNVEDANDAHMDIYHLFLDKIKLHKIDNIKSWLFVLTKNHCLGKIRKEKWKEGKINQMNIVYSEEYFHPNNEVNEIEDHQRLRKCIDQLVDNQKVCIEDFYFSKLSYQEIANARNWTWSQIRSFIQNGRRNLKKCIKTK